MSANTNNWAPPVQFHFSVVFKLPSGDTAASFRSVSGIDQTLALQQQAQQGDNDLFVSTYMLSLPNKQMLQDFLIREIQS